MPNSAALHGVEGDAGLLTGDDFRYQKNVIKTRRCAQLTGTVRDWEVRHASGGKDREYGDLLLASQYVPQAITPAQAGVYNPLKGLDPRLRGDDKKTPPCTFYEPVKVESNKNG